MRKLALLVLLLLAASSAGDIAAVARTGAGPQPAPALLTGTVNDCVKYITPTQAGDAGGACTGTPVVFVGTTAGTANAQTIASPAPGGFTFVDGYAVVAKIGSALNNTGATTWNINATGAKAVVTQDGGGNLAPLVGGEFAAGATYAAVAHTSCPAPISADCYTIVTPIGGGVTKDIAGHTVTTSEWKNWWVFDFTGSQTLTLPVVTGLPQTGGIVIKIDANATVTLTPNAADGINGNTINTALAITGPALMIMTTPGSSGVNALQVNVPVSLNMSQAWTKGQAVTPTAGGTQGVGGTLTPDFSASNSITATFGAGNLTIANPSAAAKAGQQYVIALTQDSVGSRTVTWGSQYKWASGTAPTLSTTANAKDIISCWADTTTTINCTLAVKGAS